MNQLSSFTFAIVSNTYCSLKCKHCYLTPEDFRDRTQITKEMVIAAFDHAERVMMLNPHADNFNMEFLGGETFLMPYEYWEWCLPYSIKRTEEIAERSGVRGNVNIYTNLFFRDHRYYDLIKKWATHPIAVILTSWEPDTERLGKNNQLSERWIDTIKRTGVHEISITLTDGVLEWGAEKVYKYFRDIGMTNFGFELLSQEGTSGLNPQYKSHFKNVSNFLVDFENVKEKDIGFSPLSEMKESLEFGESLTFDGSEKYYFSFLPDGTTHYSTYAGAGIKGPSVFDPEWYEKMVWDGLDPIERVMSIEHEMCHDCEYMRYCRGGNQSYKSANKLDIKIRSKEECPGNKLAWERMDQDVQKSTYLRNRLFKNLKKNPQVWFDMKYDTVFRESDLPHGSDLDYIRASVKNQKNNDTVIIDSVKFDRKTTLHKAIYFDEIQVKQVKFDDNVLKCTSNLRLLQLFLHQNFARVHLTADQVALIIELNSEHPYAQKVVNIADHVAAWADDRVEDMVIDNFPLDSKHEKYLELIAWLVLDNNYEKITKNKITTSKNNSDYIGILQVKMDSISKRARK